jgi:putative mRNA 3-end processing factor
MLLEFNAYGIYCPQAGIYIDPWQPVEKAVITHAHSDHARTGSRHYLAHTDSEAILKYRLGSDLSLQTLAYGEAIVINGVRISLHPAGHIIGSAQVRLEYEGEVWVVSGDYKTRADGITIPFEPISCQHFITESTFGMPIYNFPDVHTINHDINEWISANAREGFSSVIIGYSLGKAQRILNSLQTDLDILLHTSVYNTNAILGRNKHEYIQFTPDYIKEKNRSIVVVAPTAAIGSPWLKRFEPYKLAICSGWMQLRGARRRQNADKGFAMSDHADWKSLNEAVLATGAENIYVTHGYKSVFARWLREQHGLNAIEMETMYEGESIENTEDRANAAIKSEDE